MLRGKVLTVSTKEGLYVSAEEVASSVGIDRLTSTLVNRLMDRILHICVGIG